MSSPYTTVKAFFDPATWTVTYVLSCQRTGMAAVIDPVLDFDFKSGRTRTHSSDAVLAYLREAGLKLQWILETHAHADHLSGAQHLQQHAGGRIAIGARILQVQAVFKAVFNLEPGFKANGEPFDHLFEDGEVFQLGDVAVQALSVPGHTPADVAYRVLAGPDPEQDTLVFMGDTLFMPDVGTARADFPGGDAQSLYRSIQRLLSLPPATQLYACHDYPPTGRSPQWVSTVQQQRQHNIHVHDGISEAQFVALRQARDATLEVPTLIVPSIQVNIRAGRLPPADSNGVSYLRLPINALGGAAQAAPVRVP